MKKSNWYWWILGILILFTIYRTWLSKPNSLEVALELAGENRNELEEVIDHYKSIDKDKEKLEAARFLISNSIIHASQKTELKDLQGNPILFNPLDYSDFAATKEAKDSIFRVSSVNNRVDFDILKLESDFLIKHIDFCVEVWRESPWKDMVDFNQFCSYILPYRGTSESISYWVEALHEKYQNVLDTISEKTIINTCKALNSAIAKHISYDNRWVSGGLGVQSIPEILETKSGMCDDLTVYGLSVMRSFGLPVSIDFDIHGRFNYGHSWCVIFDENGLSESFGPGEDQPGDHKHTFSKARYRTLAKVFRKNFFINENGLYSKVKDQYTIPPFFRARNISDVTEEYVKTCNVEYYLDQALPVEQKYLYMCVFNNGRWKPIQWGELKQSEVVFQAMGPEILYMVGYFYNDRIYPVSDPFILEPDGSKRFINSSGLKVNEQFIFTRIAGFEVPKKEKEYHLYFWKDNRWKQDQTIIAEKDSILNVANLNKNTLYKFQNFSRPFMVNDSTYTWW